MSTFRASVEVEGDTLHTSRPLTAPPSVLSLVDSVVFDLTREDGAAQQGDVVRVEFTVETPGDSDTPVGDSITATSSEPLAAVGGKA